MSKTKFEYFHNHGDEDGNNSLTVCFGDPDQLESIIVTCEDTEEDAVEAVKRLNNILDEYAAQCVAEYKEKLKGMIHGRSVIRPSQVIQLIDEV
jgi:cAMP phosphodiesterase